MSDSAPTWHGLLATFRAGSGAVVRGSCRATGSPTTSPP